MPVFKFYVKIKVSSCDWPVCLTFCWQDSLMLLCRGMTCHNIHSTYLSNSTVIAFPEYLRHTYFPCFKFCCNCYILTQQHFKQVYLVTIINLCLYDFFHSFESGMALLLQGIDKYLLLYQLCHALVSFTAKKKKKLQRFNPPVFILVYGLT